MSSNNSENLNKLNDHNIEPVSVMTNVIGCF